MTPVATVIISTYNGWNTIGTAIESVIAQTVRELELLVVDDGSINNFIEKICNKYDDDKRIKYIRLKDNSGGPAIPQNIGIQMARADFIGILDHDDKAAPEWIESLLKIFKEHNKVGIAWGGAWRCDSVGKITETRQVNLFGKDIIQPFELMPILLYRIPGTSGTLF